MTETDKHELFYVPAGTKRCGFYECRECHYRFLDVRTAPKIPCPYCGEEPDMEIGPDEEIPVTSETAVLLQILEDDDVERYDVLLSLAETGGDYGWL